MPPKVLGIHPADEHHQVVTVSSDGQAKWRKKPCSDCPWRKDAVGLFPAEAFRHSANTATDMSTHKFGCHQSGKDKPATCAGFLVQGADHNLSVRLERMRGHMMDATDGGLDLFSDYVEMAIANGVDPDDPVLKPCRRRS
jgi:hypothetical protein